MLICLPTSFVILIYADCQLLLLKVPKIKSTDELIKMNKEELFDYLKEYESSVKPTDSIEVVPFEHGTKIIYYHRNQKKPYKTQVYLNKVEDKDLLK